MIKSENIIVIISIFFFIFPTNTVSQSISPIKQKLNSTTYASNDIENYKFYLENNPIDFNDELKLISNIKNEFEKDFLKSIIYKKQNEFENEFKVLQKHLNSLPQNLSYYNELIFAANASGNLKKLESKLYEKKNSKNYYLIYLFAIYNYTIGNYQEAYKNFLKVLNYLNLSDIYYQISYTQRNIGDYEKAFDFLEKGKKLLNEDSYEIPKFLIAQGSLLYLSGRYKEAVEFYKKGMQKADINGNTIEKIKAFINIGIIYDEEGNIYKAREYFNEAIKLAHKIKSIELLALANSEIGVSFTLTNELADAQKHYKISFDIYKKLNDRIRLAFLSTNLGNLKMSFADYYSALNYFNEGLKYSRENKHAQIQNLIGIADVYNNLANYTAALKYYDKAHQLASEIKDISLEAKIKLGVGSLYFNIGNPENALEIFKEAETLITNTNYPYLKSEIFHKLGITYLELEKYNVAKNYLKKSINISKETKDIFNELAASTDFAFLLCKQNKFVEALTLIKSIIPKTKKYELSNLLGMQKIILGKIYSNKLNIKEAVNIFKEVEKIGKENNNKDLLIETNFQLAEIYKQLNKNAEAEKYYLNSINLINIISKNLYGNSGIQISYFSNYKDVYDSLTEFYLYQRRFKEAFLIMESSHSRNTMQNLINMKLNSIAIDKNELQKFFESEWMINSGLYKETETDSLNNELNKIRNSLISQHPIVAKYFENENNFSIEEIQARLNKAENLVSIFISKEFIQYFLITKNDFSSDRINITREELLKLIYNISPYYNPGLYTNEIYFNQDLFSFNAQASYNLYKNIFKKIVSKIPRNELIIFNLPPELIIIPLEFLITEFNENDSPYNYDQKKFLIHDYKISYTPSFKIYLTQKNEISDNNSNILLLGDPSLQNTSNLFSLKRGMLNNQDFYTRFTTLYSLKFSRDEIKEIDALAGSTTLLLSDKATETNFKINANNKNIIHLSTHSFLFKNQPLVIFSNINDNQNDGILEIGEIINLNLTSDLVVLSSCKSGIGEINNAEGILGMQKAFYEAGAKSVVVSLWDVSDKYTAKFMAEFYKNLRDGRSKSDALRLAKIEFIKKYSSNPYYWAGFVLYGNDNAVKIQFSLIGFHYFIIALVSGILLLILFTYKKKINLYLINKNKNQ